MRRLLTAGAAATVLVLGIIALSGALIAPSAAAAATASEQFASLAKRTVDHQLNYAPTLAYFTGLPAPDHRRWPDRSAAAIAAFERVNDALLAELLTIDARALSRSEAITYDTLREQLEADVQLRACRYERTDRYDSSHDRTLQLIRRHLPSTASDTQMISSSLRVYRCRFA